MDTHTLVQLSHVLLLPLTPLNPSDSHGLYSRLEGRSRRLRPGRRCCEGVGAFEVFLGFRGPRHNWRFRSPGFRGFRNCCSTPFVAGRSLQFAGLFGSSGPDAACIRADGFNHVVVRVSQQSFLDLSGLCVSCRWGDSDLGLPVAGMFKTQRRGFEVLGI